MYAILIFASLVLGMIGIEYLLHRPFLSVRGVLITIDPASAQTNELAITNEVFSFLDAHTSLFFGHRSFVLARMESDDIAQAILADHPEWQSVRVGAYYFSRQLTVTIKPRQRVGLWCDAARSCVWFDASCMAFAPGPQPEGALIPFIVDNQSHTVPIGSAIVDGGACQNVQNVFAFLGAVGVVGATISFDTVSTDITAHASGTPEFLFNLRTDPLFAVDAIRQKLQSTFSTIAYIDVRVPNRIYYK
jgi:hypothetical protein